ncbi:hypothetical protein [Cellulomonas edaphi]|uniref:Adenylate cyclase n=1 Tax=Cellulomonas edaphi TaxID=3053468 RepID=A0ABT7S5H9_9CELL|nr:hypothetical protein [Cellulomons edaphi]MDM7830784.1 hypothetical protein [Cellulomons edaphi]
MSSLLMYDGDRLAGLLGLLPDVDAVELKLTVADTNRAAVVEQLGISPLDAEIRQVAFVDTPDLRLSAAGLVVRVRSSQRKTADITVKLRPMLPGDLPAGLRGQAGFKVEVDASPAGYVCSCSLTEDVPDKKARAVLSGERGLGGVLSDRQSSLLLDRLPEGVSLDDLVVLGPVTLLKTKFVHRDYPRRMVAELWFLPDGTRLLELSTKCTPKEAFQAAAETKAFLALHGVDLGAPQEAKTRTTLAALAASIEKE